jgi:hypothetical protein
MLTTLDDVAKTHVLERMTSRSFFAFAKAPKKKKKKKKSLFRSENAVIELSPLDRKRVSFLKEISS